MVGPLDGMRVLDWSVWQQGPVAGAMLGDLGAEVIKLEDRDGGDFGRNLATLAGVKVGQNAYFEINNRNKKSIALDLRRPEAKEILYKLIKISDIFITNLRPGVPEKMGLDYEALRKINSRLIYGSATALGNKGPERTARGYDLLGLARSGIMMASMPVGWNEPVMVHGAIADQMGAIMLAYGVLAAVIARERYGLGQKVDTSLLGSMLWLQGLHVALQVTGGVNFGRHDRSNPGNPLFNFYRCADDKWIAITLLQSDRFWADFVGLIGRPELATDERFLSQERRFNNAQACTAILDQAFAERSRQEWLELFSGRDFGVTPITDMTDIPTDPQVIANGYVMEFAHPTLGVIKIPGVPVALSQTPLGVRLRAPEFGEHTEDVLTNLLGYSWDDITRFQELEVI